MQLHVGVFAVLFTAQLMLHLVPGELDYSSLGQGMQLHGNFSLAGFFPLHYGHQPDASLPALAPCRE